MKPSYYMLNRISRFLLLTTNVCIGWRAFKTSLVLIKHETHKQIHTISNTYRMQVIRSLVAVALMVPVVFFTKWGPMETRLNLVSKIDQKIKVAPLTRQPTMTRACRVHGAALDRTQLLTCAKFAFSFLLSSSDIKFSITREPLLGCWLPEILVRLIPVLTCDRKKKQEGCFGFFLSKSQKICCFLFKN